MQQMPPQLVRAIVAAMRREAWRRAEQEQISANAIHRLRALSRLWTNLIDYDAIRRSIAIRVDPMNVHLVHYILQTTTEERRRRLLVQVNAICTNNEISAARRALANVVHFCIIFTTGKGFNENIDRMISLLPVETRTLDITSSELIGPIGTFSQYWGHLSRLQNLRRLAMVRLRIHDIERFAAQLADAHYLHLHWIDLRMSNFQTSPSIVALVNAVPSLRRLDLRSTIPRDRRARLREELCAALLERTEIVTVIL